jgi:hypothetical protein
MMQGVVFKKVYEGGPSVGWRVAGKLRANRCEGAAFLQIEKFTKLKVERGTSR